MPEIHTDAEMRRQIVPATSRRSPGSAARIRSACCVMLSVLLAAGLLRASAPSIRPANAEEIFAAVHESKARAVLVNVWATWCIPCRQEMPDILRLRERLAPALEVILVSADFRDALPEARTFLAEVGVDFPTFRKTGPDEEFIDAFDPAWSGALPATFLYDAKRRLRHSILRKTTYDELAGKVGELLESEKPKGDSGKGDRE